MYLLNQYTKKYWIQSDFLMVGPSNTFPVSLLKANNVIFFQSVLIPFDQLEISDDSQKCNLQSSSNAIFSLN